MLLKFTIAAILIWLLWRGIYQFKHLPPAEKKPALIRTAIFFIIAAMIFGAVTGRTHWLGAVAAAHLELLRFGAGAAFKILPFWMSRGGIVPFKTEYLDVRIQIKTGELSGTIRKGEFEGRSLHSLTEQELKSLADLCQQADPKAFYLLKYLHKNSRTDQDSAPSFGAPEIQEALDILGLKANPTREEILKAHKRLIQKLHPDRGGSDFLAARVNPARDVLLRSLT